MSLARGVIREPVLLDNVEALANFIRKYAANCTRAEPKLAASRAIDALSRTWQSSGYREAVEQAELLLPSAVSWRQAAREALRKTGHADTDDAIRAVCACLKRRKKIDVTVFVTRAPQQKVRE